MLISFLAGFGVGLLIGALLASAALAFMIGARRLNAADACDEWEGA